MTPGPDDAARNALEQAHRAAETAARQSYGKLVAFLAARTGDVALAEDALSEAFASAALEGLSGDARLADVKRQ